MSVIHTKVTSNKRVTFGLTGWIKWYNKGEIDKSNNDKINYYDDDDGDDINATKMILMMWKIIVDLE